MLTWLGNDALILEDLAFELTFPRRARVASIPERFSRHTFLLHKPRWLVEQYVDLLAHLQPRHIFEIGIRNGGSTVFLSTLSDSKKYVAIDIEDASTLSFQEWVRNGPFKDRVVVHFGVDQSDATALRSLATDEFDGEALDLVIDDASHLLAPTRTSFEALFPRLRPGGIYVIEDWETQHRTEQMIRNEIDSNPGARALFEEELRKRAGTWPELREPITKLLVQIMLATAYTDIIDNIWIRHGSAMIRRGNDDLDRESFALSDFYLELGRELLGEQPDTEPPQTDLGPRDPGIAPS